MILVQFPFPDLSRTKLRPAVVLADDLATTFTDHGTPAAFEGVLLTDVLAEIDLSTGEKYHSTAAAYYLLVEAKDGYRAPRSDEAGWPAAHREGRSISLGGARGEKRRKVGPAGDGADG